ncbi:MAG TPA: methyl-accepting chemotaxis protein [Steroidobacteraceae bacterium]|jgi:methyl-accepting chemotaxis protein|nr:methyl-accepting chemotaxis protein [Steroidobacteraceae bacterium]
MNLLLKMHLRQKFALLLLAMALPTVLVAVFYLSQSNRAVTTARNELDGARYVQSVGSLLARVTRHRTVTNALLSGDTSGRLEGGRLEAYIETQIKQLDVLDTELGGRFGTSALWHEIDADWRQIRSSAGSVTPEQNLSAHDELIQRITTLMARVSKASDMDLDSDAFTDDLIIAATRNVAQAVIAFSNVDQHSMEVVVKGYLGGDDRAAIQIYLEEIRRHLDAIAQQLVAQPQMQPLLLTTNEQLAGYWRMVSTRILNADKITITGSEVYAAGSPVVQALQVLSDSSYVQMENALRQRAGNETTKRDVTIAVAAGALAIALLISWTIATGLRRSLGRAVVVFQEIADGRYNNDIPDGGADEAGQVLAGLRNMQGKLRLQIETERAAAAENARIRQALDRVSTSVILADAAQTIIYINDIGAQMFARREEQIRRVLPGFAASRLLGASLDILSAEAAHQHELVERMTVSHTQDVKLGECTFRIVISAVMGRDGQRIGTVMEWTERTPEVAVESQMQSMLHAVLAGDLTQRLSLEGKTGFFAVLSHSVNQLADNMAEIVATVKLAARDVYRGAEGISQGNVNLSQRTLEQVASLEATAASVARITATVRQNAESAGRASTLASTASEQAQNGGAVVTQAMRAMADINDASRRIADIIGVIDEIAFQTNLLALNAAVEAARAGEHGRGFAVVANEVRNLAGRSATAAREIKALIQDSVRKVNDGSELVNRSGETLGEIVASIKTVSGLVAEIAAASRDQSQGIVQINQAVLQMDQFTQTNGSLVAQATAASQTMAQRAGELNGVMERYQLDEAHQQPGSSAAAQRALEAAEQALPEQPAQPRAAERRGAARPWVANGPARTTKAKAAAPAPRFNKVADDDSDWKEF